jgi:hypothetical protein
MNINIRSSNDPLGDFANSGQYLKIYQKLNLTYTTSLSSFTADKFSQLRRGCLEVYYSLSLLHILFYASSTFFIFYVLFCLMFLFFLFLFFCCNSGAKRSYQMHGEERDSIRRRNARVSLFHLRNRTKGIEGRREEEERR